jgi:predicted small lipoprotein YifL
MLRTVLILLAATMLLAGCGRRGGLEAPGSAVETEPLFAPEAILDDASPGAQDPEPQAQPDAPERRFILDPLI